MNFQYIHIHTYLCELVNVLWLNVEESSVNKLKSHDSGGKILFILYCEMLFILNKQMDGQTDVLRTLILQFRCLFSLDDIRHISCQLV